MLSKKAVVLLSGGLDSTTVLAIAKEQGYIPYALSFDYGQKNRFELLAAARIAKRQGAAEHKVLKLDLGSIGGSSLTTNMELETNRPLSEIGKRIPSTYVPVRNTLFLSYALAWAEVLGCADLFIGVNAIDTSGYPDCRPEYIEAFSRLANLATKLGSELGREIKIHAPLQTLSKVQIIQRGLELGIDYSETSTCYQAAMDGTPCGECDACILRNQAFKELGLVSS